MYDDLTIEENLAFFAAVLGVDRARVDACVHVVDLHGERSKVVGRLSGDSGPASRSRSRSSGSRPSSFSTSRRSAWTRCCAETCGRPSTASLRTALRCSSPVT